MCLSLLLLVLLENFHDRAVGGIDHHAAERGCQFAQHDPAGVFIAVLAECGDCFLPAGRLGCILEFDDLGFGGAAGRGSLSASGVSKLKASCPVVLPV